MYADMLRPTVNHVYKIFFNIDIHEFIPYRRRGL